MAKKTNKINLDLGWPCYACCYNDREGTKKPCVYCRENAAALGPIEEHGNYFEPILEPT